LSIEHRA